MAYNAKLALKYLMPDKCRPDCDMGMSIQFADPMPGVNDTDVRPFGWSEYESAFRHQYVPDPNVKKRICRDPCKPRGTARKAAPRQFFDPCCSVPRNNICSLCRMAKCRCKIPPPWKECKEKVVVYDPDSVRDLIVHGELKNEHPIVLSNCDYNKILNKALVKTKEEKQQECKEGLEAKQREIERCRKLADEMRTMDRQAFNETLSPEAREAEEEILGRANTIILEDEPEVRTINKVILAAKVQAIREAQLAEKELIRCEQAQEEERLRAMVANTDNPLLKDEAREWEAIEKKKKTLAQALRGQLDEREAMKYLEKKLLEHERTEMKKIWEMQDMEDIVLRNAELEKKARLGKELLEDQLQQLEKKKMLKAWDRQEDEQMLEWMAKKDAEAERAEREEAEKKRLRELALKEVFSTKEKQDQSKALREELRIKRYQEQQEREWRQQEREQAMKHRKAAEELKNAILSQIRQRQEEAINQAAFEKAMYDKIYGIHRMKFDEDTSKEEEKKIKNAQYKLDLREQIHKDQLSKIQQRKDFFVEGISMRRELGRREKEIRATLECKLQELKAANLPEKYINYVRKAVEEELKPDWQKSISKHGMA